MTENWHTWSLGGADLESVLRILKFRPQNPFLANLDWKSQSCLFCLKIGTHYILRILILIPTLVFWISYPKSIYGQIWAKKVKVVCFAWKLVHMVPRGCWFLFLTLVFWISNPKAIFGKFGSKKSELSVLPEIDPHGISRMVILIPTFVFWIFNP